MNNPLPPPPLELTHHAQCGWLERLVGCVVTLGPRLGWRYWRIEQRAYKHPECVLEWASRCRREAITAPEPYRTHCLDWATQLEDNFEKWSRQDAANAAGELPPPPERKL
jgi:hypothetical protein